MKKLSPVPQCLSIKLLAPEKVVSAPHLGMLRHIPIYACPRTTGLRWEYDTERLVSAYALFDQDTGVELQRTEWIVVYLGGRHFCPFKDTEDYMVVGILGGHASWSKRLSDICDRILDRLILWKGRR